MSKYTAIKLRAEVIDLLKRCQRPREPLSDTLMALIDPMKVHEREKERNSDAKNHTS